MSAVTRLAMGRGVPFGARRSIDDFVAAAAPEVRRLAGDLTAGIRHSLDAIAIPRRL